MTRRSDLARRRSELSPEKKALLDEWSQGMAPPPATRALITRQQRDKVPLSFSQERLWFLDQLEPNNPAYNVTRAVRLSGPLNPDTLERSLIEIWRRHEALRTTFMAVHGQPVQVIAPALRRSEMPVGDVALSVIDLRSLSGDERESEARRLASKEARQPFDLAQGPLLRTSLLWLTEDECIFLLTMHHIVSDGWSIDVLFRELSALYQAFSAGEQSPLPELPIQYADYALWQRQWLKGSTLDAQLAYWRQQLAGAAQLLDLPSDHPRPRVQTYHGAEQATILPKALTSALVSLSQQEGVTLFMTLLAAFQTLLHRYTGQTDIAVGSPVANRTRTEVEGLIGFFVNTLVLRTDFSGNPTFRQLLRQMRETCLGAYSHQELPFEKLVEELQPVRDLSYPPLFQAMLVLQNPPTHALDLPGLSASDFYVRGSTAQYDLNLVLRENGDGLHAKLLYSTDLFEAATARCMLDHYLRLLEGSVADPDQRISGLPLLTNAEQHRMLVAWNDTLVDYPLGLCTHELFERQVDRTPDAVAVAFEEQQVTYRELNRRANQIANYLRNQGIETETLVGLCMTRSVDWVVGLLGILKSGAAFVPMDPAYPPERLLFMLQDTELSWVLTSEELLARLSGYGGRRICLDREERAITRESAQNPNSGATASSLAYVIYTSGSTGSPKGVMIEHKGLVNLTLAQIDAYDIRPEARFLQTFALSSDAAIAQVTRPLCAGATLQLASEQSLLPGPDMIRLLLDTGVTHLNLPPSMLQLLPTQELPEVKVVVVGGEACPADLVTRWAPGRKFINAYGPTEATVGSTIHECVADGQPPSIGRPIANKQIFVLDHHLQPVPVGVPGELCIGGIGLARGYWGQPDLTAERFIPNPFSSEPGARMYRTGDLARYLPDGNIEFLGRLDHQVKLRGFRIEVGEIEAVLGQHPKVREVVVLLRETARGDERLVAYVVPEDGTTGIPSDLRHFLQDKLPDYMVPSAFMMLKVLPLTPNGKVNRRALPTPDGSRPELAQTFVPPRTPVEEMLAGIWVQVLDIDRVGAHDDFFDLGGHSLLATRVIFLLRNLLQWELPLRTIFEAPTVAELSKVMVAQETIPGRTERAALLLKKINSMPTDELETVLEAQRQKRDTA